MLRQGTYIIVAAEGIKTASGELLYDESAGVDAFGHKKLSGAGKYVRHQLEKRMKTDPAVTEFMKKTGMWAPGVYETHGGERGDAGPSCAFRRVFSI